MLIANQTLRRLVTPIIKYCSKKKAKRLFGKFFMEYGNDAAIEFLNKNRPDFSLMKPIHCFKHLHIVLRNPMDNCYHKHVESNKNIYKQGLKAAKMLKKPLRDHKDFIDEEGRLTMGECSHSYYYKELLCVTYAAPSGNELFDKFAAMHEEAHVIQKARCIEAYEKLRERFLSLGYYVRFDILSNEEQADIIALLVMMEGHGTEVAEKIKNTYQELNTNIPCRAGMMQILWDKIFPDTYLPYNTVFNHQDIGF